MIIARKAEQEKLAGLFAQKKPSFLAVYGRRRIGKTYLISRYFAEKTCFYFEVTGVAGASKPEQLRNFHRVLSGSGDRFEDWDEALHALWEKIAALPRKTKVVVFLDELPWLAGQKSGFLTALDYFWNRRLSRRDNTLLIVCGSAAAWMIRKVIDDRGGLHNRVTHRMPMQAFTIAETEAYLGTKGARWERQEILRLYMALGGVALYLDQVDRRKSAAENIDRICFGAEAFLGGEFERLFRSLFGASGRHVQLVRVLAGAKKGLTFPEIVAKSGLHSGGTITTTLDELRLSGFVEASRETWKKKKGTRYRLIDEFSLFHLTWMDGVQGDPPAGTRAGTWLRAQQTGRFNAWSGYAFENFCFRHKEQLVSALGLAVVAESISTWSTGPDAETGEAGAQIDIVIDRRDRCLNLCEAKYSQAEYTVTKSMAKSLNHKRERFRQMAKRKRQLFTTLVTVHGAKKTAAYLASVDQDVTLEDFFIDR